MPPARWEQLRPWLSGQAFVASPKTQATTWITPYSTSEAEAHGDRVPYGHGFARLAVGNSAIWATSSAEKAVVRIDPHTLRMTERIGVRRMPAAISMGRDAAWVVCSNGWLWRLRSGGGSEGVARLDGRVRGLVCEGDSAWVLRAGGSLIQIDQATGETGIEARVRRGARQLLRGSDGTLLAICANGHRLSRVSTGTGEIEAEASLPGTAICGTVLGETAWIAGARRLAPEYGALVPVDLATMTVGHPLPLPGSPRAIAADARHIWAASGRRGKRPCAIDRIDPASGETTRWADSDWNVYDLAADGDRLLVAAGLFLNGPAGTLSTDGAIGGAPAHHGGAHGGGGGHGGGHGGH